MSGEGPSIRFAAVSLAACVIAAGSCTLPSYSKVEEVDNTAKNRDAGSVEEAPSCTADLETTGGCRKCIAEHCCGEASACKNGACGAGLRFPLAPPMHPTAKFDMLAECLMANCDTSDTCDVSWGCVGKYKWPELDDDHSFKMRVFGYADPKEVGIPNINVNMCDTTAPSCTQDEGLVDSAKTDAMGNAEFTLMTQDKGYFDFELEGVGTAPSTVQWNQPVYNEVTVFTHQALATKSVQGLALASRYHTSETQPFREGTGFLIARAQNCLPLRYMEGANPLARARDVRFAFMPNTGASRVFYINDMSTLDTSLDRTSSRGYAGAFELESGNVTVTAIHAVTEKVLAQGTIGIKAGNIGFMYLVPNTNP